jgi:hypothetical protein
MTDFFEILKYTLPAIIVFLATWVLIANYSQREKDKRKMELATKNQKTITPIRLQAYERVILFLERINPESMIMRLNRQGVTCRQLQTEMISNIRAEFEHNLSQQVYMSSQAWELVKSARSNLIKIINNCAEKVNPDSPSINLSKSILEFMMEMEKSPINVAIEYIKKEVKTYF